MYRIIFRNSLNEERLVASSDDADEAVKFANNALNYYRSAPNTTLIDYSRSFVILESKIARFQESCDTNKTSTF